MPTNRFVESSFWNFDSLFQPQSHPARDMHDTFFVSRACVTCVSQRSVDAHQVVCVVLLDRRSHAASERPRGLLAAGEGYARTRRRWVYRVRVADFCRSDLLSCCLFLKSRLLLRRYRYDWKREEAEKYILRTHTTAVSARMLYEVANVRLAFDAYGLFCCLGAESRLCFV